MTITRNEKLNSRLFDIPNNFRLIYLYILYLLIYFFISEKKEKLEKQNKEKVSKENTKAAATKNEE